MAMDDLPLPVLAPVDMGDAEGVRVNRGTVHRRCRVFVADGVGQVPTDTGGDELKAIGGAGGEARREPAEERTHVVRPGP